MKNEIKVTLTDSQKKQLDNLAEIRGCSSEDLASDIVAVFLVSVTQPLIQLPVQRQKEKENE